MCKCTYVGVEVGGTHSISLYRRGSVSSVINAGLTLTHTSAVTTALFVSVTTCPELKENTHTKKMQDGEVKSWTTK